MAGAKRRSDGIGQNTLAAEILARFGTSDGLTVERLESELERERYDIVAALRELQTAGAGTWVTGRKGGKSRFVWSRQPPAQAGGKQPSEQSKRARRGPAAAAVSRPAPEAKLAMPQDSSAPSRSECPALLEHSFHVRKGVLVSLRLPADVTAAEMERLCQFLQAIPFR